jgi:hypothetical protein
MSQELKGIDPHTTTRRQAMRETNTAASALEADQLIYHLRNHVGTTNFTRKVAEQAADMLECLTAQAQSAAPLDATVKDKEIYKAIADDHRRDAWRECYEQGVHKGHNDHANKERHPLEGHRAGQKAASDAAVEAGAVTGEQMGLIEGLIAWLPSNCTRGNRYADAIRALVAHAQRSEPARDAAGLTQSVPDRKKVLERDPCGTGAGQLDLVAGHSR